MPSRDGDRLLVRFSRHGVGSIEAEAGPRWCRPTRASIGANAARTGQRLRPLQSLYEIPIPGNLDGDEWERRLTRMDERGIPIEMALRHAAHIEHKHSAAGRAETERRLREYNLARQLAAQQASGRPVVMPFELVAERATSPPSMKATTSSEREPASRALG